MKDKVIFGLFFIGVLLFAWMQLFVLPSEEKKLEEESLMQLNPEIHDFNKVLPYEHLYMGNASNNGNLFRNLPLSQYLGTFEMASDRLLLIVNYSAPENESKHTIEQAILYNTTAAFVLIKNLEQVEMRFPDQSFIVRRSNVEKWFGSDFIELTDPIKFKGNVQEPLKKNDLKEWITMYTESSE